MDAHANIRIIFAGNDEDPFIVLYKPAGMPSAPLRSDEPDTALQCAAVLFPHLCAVQGKKSIEYGLLHRLDTDTEGLILIALTQQSYDALYTAQIEGHFIKKYTALCENARTQMEGFPEPPHNFLLKNASFPLTITSRFRPYGAQSKSVRPVLSVVTEKRTFAQKKAGVTHYTTHVDSAAVCTYKPNGENIAVNTKSVYRVECSLTHGFRHQIRCHLSWIGVPLIGDKLYNSSVQNSNSKLHLYAHTLEFLHPLSGKQCVFTEKSYLLDNDCANLAN